MFNKFEWVKKYLYNSIAKPEKKKNKNIPIESQKKETKVCG